MNTPLSPAVAAPALTNARLASIVELLLRAAAGMLKGARPATSIASPQAASDETDESIEAGFEGTRHARTYLQRLRGIARLSVEAELDAVARARDPHATDQVRESARRELIRANLWVVPVIVRRFYRHGSSFDDLVAEGNMGLYRALERFDPSRGFRFSTYAKWWVVDAVTGAMAANAYPVRVPRKVAQALARRRRDDDGPPASDSAAPQEYPIEGVHAVHEHDAVELEDCDAQPALDVVPEQIVALREALRLLAHAVTELPPRERRVIEGRYGLNGRGEETLQQIGDELGVTAERVRTLQLSAMALLRRRFEGGTAVQA